MRNISLIALVLCLGLPVVGIAADFSYEIAAQKEVQAAEGVVYRKYQLKTSAGMVAVHTVRVSAYGRYAVMPIIANGQLNTVAPVDELAKSFSAAAAINGGFFDTGKTRLPVGLVKIKRRIIFEQFLNRGVLGIDEHGLLHFDRFRLHSYLYIPAIDAATPIHGYNRKRKNEELIVYTPEFGPTTKSNEWGVEIMLHRISPDRLDEAFVLLEPDRYIITSVNRQDSTIPPDGVVLSIHRPALGQIEWLNQVYLGMEMQLRSNVPSGWESYPYLLGGGPLLLQQNKVVLDPRAEQFGNYFNGRHARTAVGSTATGDSVIIVVDKGGGSIGASWDELALICRDLLGCSSALGFDGGGSSTMFLGDEVVNAPAGGGQRQVANILAVVPFEKFI